MKNQRIKTVGAILAAILIMTGLNAQSPRQERMAHHFALDLSQEQKDELNSIRMEHYKKMKPLKNQMAELKLQEQTLLSEDEVDLKAVNKVIDEQTELINTMKKLQVEQKVKFRNILTDEQIMKFEQSREFNKHRRIPGNDFRRAPCKGKPYHRNVG